MDSQSEVRVQSSHNSSETTNVTVSSLDDLRAGQQLCIEMGYYQEWDRMKGYAMEHGPEVLFGAVEDEEWKVCSVLTWASLHQNVEMVKLTLEAGFDNKEAMYFAATESMRKSDNSTILRLLLEHGLDPDMDLRLNVLGEHCSNLLMFAIIEGHIDHAIALLDHGAKASVIITDSNLHLLSPLTVTLGYGENDICRLLLTRGAILSMNDVDVLFGLCLSACKGEHPRLSRDLAIKMFVTFLHLGNPFSNVVRDKFNSFQPSDRDPTITNITKLYLQGLPFCCFVCEALTAKGRDKLLVCPCRTVAYCSRECQVKHWREHKVQCTGPLNERGESEAMVKGRHKTGKGAAAGATVVGVAERAVATGKNGKKGKKGKNGRGKKK
jgi:hypothetical protein